MIQKTTKEIPTMCDTCKRPLTYQESHERDDDILGTCDECFRKVIDGMVDEGLLVVNNIDGVPHIQLTRKGLRKVRKEVK